MIRVDGFLTCQPKAKEWGFQPSYLSWLNSDRPRRAQAVILSSSRMWGELTVKSITLEQFVTLNSWISFLSIEPRNLLFIQSYQHILSSSPENQVPSRSHSRTSWGLVHLMSFFVLAPRHQVPAFFSSNAEKYFLAISHSYICEKMMTQSHPPAMLVNLYENFVKLCTYLSDCGLYHPIFHTVLS